MGDILPEYAAYHRELQAAIDNPQHLPETALASAADHITATASTTGSESELLDEINKMSGAAASVDKSFGDVAKLFVNVRNGLSSPAVKADMQKLEVRWNAHHQVSPGPCALSESCGDSMHCSSRPTRILYGALERWRAKPKQLPMVIELFRFIATLRLTDKHLQRFPPGFRAVPRRRC